MTTTLHWTFEDTRAVLRRGDVVLGEVRYHEPDTMFYDAVVGGMVVATSNEVFALLHDVQEAAQRQPEPPNALLAAARKLLEAREDQMVTSEEWDALKSAVAVCEKGAA